MTAEIFEIIILALINTFSVFLIVVVLGNSLKDKLYRWFVIMTILLTCWVDFSYIAYIEKNLGLATFFYRINVFFSILYFFVAYVFYVESFLHVKKKILKWGIFLTSLALAFMCLLTDKFIAGVTAETWGNEIILGPMDPVLNGFAVFVAVIIIYYSVSRYFTLPAGEKRKILYFLVGTILLIVFNVLFNVIFPAILGSSRYQHFGDYSAIIFLGFTALAILKHKFLGVKVALTAFLIGIIGTLLAVDILVLSHSLLEQGVKAGIFVFFVLISVVLVRSVVTEMKQREQLAKTNKALDKSRQRYIDLAEEQKDIIDVMGHEIRTPLTAIVQELNIHKKLTIPQKSAWLSGKISREKEKQMLELVYDTFDTVDKASLSATELVQSMLETARLDKKRFELMYTTFDVVILAKDCVNLMRKTIEVHNCTIAYEPKIEKLMVEADEVRIKEAINSLLNNAIKYRDLAKKESLIEVRLDKVDSFCVISVKDNGIGMREEDISKLGKKFARLDETTPGGLKRPGGTGLGLFVVKGIMEYHKGQLIIETLGVGKGSIFTLKFPIKRNGHRAENKV